MVVGDFHSLEITPPNVHNCAKPRPGSLPLWASVSTSAALGLFKQEPPGLPFYSHILAIIFFFLKSSCLMHLCSEFRIELSPALSCPHHLCSNPQCPHLYHGTVQCQPLCLSEGLSEMIYRKYSAQHLALCYPYKCNKHSHLHIVPWRRESVFYMCKRKPEK